MPAHAPTTFDLAALTLSVGETKTFQIGLYLPPLRLADQDYGFVPAQVPARLAVTYVGQGFTVSLKFSCRLEGPCWRCLEPATIDLDVTAEDFFETELPPMAELGESDEPSLCYEEDGVLNLSEWARDEVVEMLPPKILCDLDCRGLCAQCGANLNVRQCGCEPPVDTRWDKLREWQGE